MTKEEENLIIAEQNKSTEEILKAVTKMKADYHELCKLKDMRIAELEKENAELKEVHESDKRSLALIAKKGADFEKAYNEAEELLDKQIEATFKVVEENKELKERVENQKSFLKRIRAKFNLGKIDRKEIEGYLEGDQLTYAKTIIQDLLENTDEYARQRAEDFLKENK